MLMFMIGNSHIFDRPYLSTREAAAELHMSTGALSAAVYRGTIPEPPRDSCGRFIWTPAALKAARKVLDAGHRRPAKVKS